MLFRKIEEIARPLLCGVLIALAGAGAARAQNIRVNTPPPPGTQGAWTMQGQIRATTGTAARGDAATSRTNLFQTRDALGVYSGRPVLAVGDVTTVSLTSRTLTVRIDRALSSLPHALEIRAKRKGALEKLKERVFPPLRTFSIRRETVLLDSQRAVKMPPSTPPRERFNKMRIKLEDLRPGDRVSLTFRYYENDERPPSVFNVSKQPRQRRDYEADYRQAPVIHYNRDANALSTQTRARLAQTSGTHPMGTRVPPPGRMTPPAAGPAPGK